MPKAMHDYDVCASCTHTVNIHDDRGRCRAHGCFKCAGYELKK